MTLDAYLDRLRAKDGELQQTEFGYAYRLGVPRQEDYLSASLRVGGLAGNDLRLSTSSSDFMIGLTDQQLAGLSAMIEAHLRDKP